MADRGFEFPNFSGTVRMFAGEASAPIELTGRRDVPLNRLPFDLHLHAEEGNGCGIVLPIAAGGDEITLLSSTGSLNLRLTHEGISFVVPATGEQALISGRFFVGDDVTVRPFMAAPPLPAVCRHGISPISKCPFTPP
jgi:hypothetical protein